MQSSWAGNPRFPPRDLTPEEYKIKNIRVSDRVILLKNAIVVTVATANRYRPFKVLYYFHDI